MSPVQKSHKCGKCHGRGWLRRCPECHGDGEITTHKNGKPVMPKKTTKPKRRAK